LNFVWVTPVNEVAQLSRDGPALAASGDEHLARLFEQAPGFITTLKGPEHIFEFTNSAYRRLFGARDFVGRTVRSVFPELHDQGLFQLLDQVYATGARFIAHAIPVRIEPPGAASEQHFLNFIYQPIMDTSGQVTGIFVEGHDVTEQTNAQEALRQSERAVRELNETLELQVEQRTSELRLHENIIQSDRSLIVAFDQNYRVTVFNEAHSREFFRLFGHRAQLGEVLPDLFPPNQAAVLRGFLDRALAGETFTVVEAFGDPDRAKPTFEVSYSPLEDAAGRIIGAFHHARDISARLRGEAELAKAQEQLRQSQKMEAVGQLTGGLAHDFNNLLAGISGSLELMEARIAQGRLGEVDRYMIAAQGAVRRAAALTHRLLAFSRLQTLAPKVMDVNHLVAGIEDMIRRTVGPGIALECALGGSLWNVAVDASQLENALLNLAINARDAMPDGGKLTIETSNRSIDERVGQTRGLPAGQYVSLCVSDNGTGMAADVIEKAFDPFFTTKPLGKGTGLGLSMVYGFARQSDGQVRIHSEVGQGTMVSLFLPRHMGEAEGIEETKGPGVATASAQAGETVLVIDDEAVVRMLVVDILEELGYVALEAGDGPEGLEVLRSKARVDLLITDVGLPGGLNGRQVAEAARAMRPELKVLFITGYAEHAVLNHSHLDPGMQVVTKPFAVEELGRKVQAILLKT
jgi:PAS domain S-box-containing protein